ncbi:hypothetical protein GGR50DRAFT_682453 [Xylaria sp. CBS 124048]|nr:hypothetical protein GGR50DRAFT_682453 [Xylaria sp. CBS 124048]
MTVRGRTCTLSCSPYLPITPEEEKKLMRLYAWGYTWSAIIDAMPGRTASSCFYTGPCYSFMHSRKRLAWQHLPNTNSMAQAYAKRRAEMWDSIRKKLSLSCDEAETLFLYPGDKTQLYFTRTRAKARPPTPKSNRNPNRLVD